MTINELEQELAALKEKQDKLTAEMERLKAEPEVKPWRAEQRQHYYRIRSYGVAELIAEVGDCYDEGAYLVGNYYRTKELAEQDAKELALRGRVRQLRDALCEGYQFKHGEASFYIFFDGEYYRYSASCDWRLLGTIYFDTAEHAQQACDILNADLTKGENNESTNKK